MQPSKAVNVKLIFITADGKMRRGLQMQTFEILLVEDNPDDRFVFQRAVIASGIPAIVTFAPHAAEAVSRLNRFGAYADTPLPALIVLDLGLPGITGKTLLQVVRNAYGPQSVPIIVLTGSSAPADKEECASWGISGFLVKPDDFDSMIKFVTKLPGYIASGPNRISPMIERQQTVPSLTPRPQKNT